jgi:carboxylesterase type B
VSHLRCLLNFADSLFVDVWVPINASDAKLPVKVWLYGGNNLAGGISNPLYDGCFSVDAIQVSINYRVGPLGFLAADSLGLTGNYGIEDQLLGLRWVQDNIAAFGGDPNKVLLFGQSAGADDVLILSSLPDAAGKLFHAAILESGDYSALPNETAASGAYASFIAALNCTGSVDCLRHASLDALNKTALAMPDLPTTSLDGTTVRDQPMAVGPRVPVIVGTLANEGALSVLAQYQASAFSLNQSSYDSWLLSYFDSNASLATIVNTTYSVANFSAAPFPVFAAMTAVLTDSAFRCPARRVLRAANVSSVPVYSYRFKHTLSCAWVPQIPQLQPVLQLLGAAHTSELPLVFGEVSNLPAPEGSCNLTAAELQLSAQIRAAWTAMARDADPGAGWPKWTPGDGMGVNVVGERWEIGEVDYAVCDFWDSIQRTVSAGSYPTASGSGATSTAAAGTAPTVTPAGAAARTSQSGTSGVAVLLGLMCGILLT